ncbi:hypothetical protein M011DRAFT_481815 [Sporormia fimetaria CBS 119925]|uniref:Uncharacterized protein n=1 Tax=Sporormia fimetaria CBS 119925 TaxID=1340428 RepID=A0A6A6UZD6_9PLEO|nr:hypothetical protein M011DRAFT_481815 [Sporormia fimetaria CBS 119925]
MDRTHNDPTHWGVFDISPAPSASSVQQVEEIPGYFSPLVPNPQDDGNRVQIRYPGEAATLPATYWPDRTQAPTAAGDGPQWNAGVSSNGQYANSRLHVPAHDTHTSNTPAVFRVPQQDPAAAQLVSSAMPLDEWDLGFRDVAVIAGLENPAWIGLTGVENRIDPMFMDGYDPLAQENQVLQAAPAPTQDDAMNPQRLDLLRHENSTVTAEDAQAPFSFDNAPGVDPIRESSAVETGEVDGLQVSEHFCGNEYVHVDAESEDDDDSDEEIDAEYEVNDNPEGQAGDQGELAGDPSEWGKRLGAHLGRQDSACCAVRSTPSATSAAGPQTVTGARLHQEEIGTDAFKRDVHPVQSCCPSEEVSLVPLGDHIPTIPEILTYFPRHTKWYEVSWRLRDNGWTGDATVEYILYTRDIDDKGALTSSTVSKQHGSSWESAHKAHRADTPSTGAEMNWEGAETKPWILYEPGRIDLTARPKPHRPVTDTRLIDLAEGVRRWPAGEDATVLTAAILLAIRTDEEVLLSDFQAYVQRNRRLRRIAAAQSHLTRAQLQARDKASAIRYLRKNHAGIDAFLGKKYKRKRQARTPHRAANMRHDDSSSDISSPKAPSSVATNDVLMSFEELFGDDVGQVPEQPQQPQQPGSSHNNQGGATQSFGQPSGQVVHGQGAGQPGGNVVDMNAIYVDLPDMDEILDLLDRAARNDDEADQEGADQLQGMNDAPAAQHLVPQAGPAAQLPDIQVAAPAAQLPVAQAAAAAAQLPSQRPPLPAVVQPPVAQSTAAAAAQPLAMQPAVESVSLPLFDQAVESPMALPGSVVDGSIDMQGAYPGFALVTNNGPTPLVIVTPPVGPYPTTSQWSNQLKQALEQELRRAAANRELDEPQILVARKRANEVVQISRGVTPYAWAYSRLLVYLGPDPQAVLAERVWWGLSHPLHSFSPSPHVDIRFMGAIPCTLVELLTFFPRHTIWREVSLRLFASGMGYDAMARFIYWSRHLADGMGVNATTIRTHGAHAWEFAKASQRHVRRATNPVSLAQDGHWDHIEAHGIRFAFGPGYSTERAQRNHPTEPLMHIHLAHLAHGVHVWPQGEDASFLTAAVRLANAQQLPVLLSQYVRFVRNTPSLSAMVRYTAAQLYIHDKAAAVRFGLANPEIATRMGGPPAGINYRRK